MTGRVANSRTCWAPAAERWETSTRMPRRSISRTADTPARVNRPPVPSSPLPSASGVRPKWVNEAMRTPNR